MLTRLETKKSKEIEQSQSRRVGKSLPKEKSSDKAAGFNENLLRGLEFSDDEAEETQTTLMERKLPKKNVDIPLPPSE